MQATIKKHYARCYRISAGTELFGQARKEGSKWHAELRCAHSGELRRHAGIWSTLNEAMDEMRETVERGF